MLRIYEGINLGGLSEEEVGILLNACFAASAQRLAEGAKIFESRLGEDWFVYQGGYHLAVGKRGKEETPCLKLLDIADPHVSVRGCWPNICADRLSLGLDLSGTKILNR